MIRYLIFAVIVITSLLLPLTFPNQQEPLRVTEVSQPQAQRVVSVVGNNTPTIGVQTVLRGEPVLLTLPMNGTLYLSGNGEVKYNLRGSVLARQSNGSSTSLFQESLTRPTKVLTASVDARGVGEYSAGIFLSLSSGGRGSVTLEIATSGTYPPPHGPLLGTIYVGLSSVGNGGNYQFSLYGNSTDLLLYPTNPFQYQNVTVNIQGVLEKLRSQGIQVENTTTSVGVWVYIQGDSQVEVNYASISTPQQQ